MLVTILGAAGSLGRALTEVILDDDHQVIGFDSNEWALAAYRHDYPEATAVMADMSDWYPGGEDVVIICSAYKHIDLCEENPLSAIENNITKLETALRRASHDKVMTLFISTDKAVKPISTYGFTKAIGERLAQYYGAQVARLGNIMGSSGSVIPVWERQIENREPLTVTSLKMKRYLISQEFAAKEIWGGFKLGYKLIIPEMGEPVKITDLLSQILRKHNIAGIEAYKPGIEIIGLRGGEKLDEVLTWTTDTPNTI